MTDRLLKCHQCGNMQPILIAIEQNKQVCTLCFSESNVQSSKHDEYPHFIYADINVARNRIEQKQTIGN